MKKIFLAIFSTFLLISCDDGKVEVSSFDFSDTTPTTCNAGSSTGTFFVYSMKTNRAIIMKIDESNFANSLADLNKDKNLTIGTTNIVTYREYANTIITNNICGYPTDASNPLIKEWSGVGGTINIVKNIQRTNPDATTGATSYPNYSYTITLLNPTFSSDGFEQKNDVIYLNKFTKTNDNALIDVTSLNPKSCTATGTITLYKTSANQSLVLTLDPTLFNTTLGVKTKIIDATNTLNFKVHSSTTFSDSMFCGTTSLPSTVESWKAINGTISTGIIEVTTSLISATSPQQYLHTIVLKNVTLESVSPAIGSSFNLGFNYKFGIYKN